MSRVALAHVHTETKEEQKLSDHLMETGELAESFAAKIGLSEAGLILGLLHDFGKYSTDFQMYLGSAAGSIDPDCEEYVDSQLLKGKIDHSSAGAQYVWKKLSNIGKQGGQGALCGQILALCIASHHSGLIDCLDKRGGNTFHRRMGKADEKSHLNECLSSVEEHLGICLNDKLNASLVKSMLQKIALICEWPGVGQPEYSKISGFSMGMLTRYLFSCLIDADRINSSEFEFPRRKIERKERRIGLDWQVAIDRLEDKLAAFPIVHEIDHIRRQIAANCESRASSDQQIFTLTVPTGGGKTLSSLRFALNHAKRHQLDRIIFIVPFTTIIEQNAESVRGVIERDADQFPWVLEHHSNLEPEQQTWRSKIIAENWDAPIVFTTMVQFLETLFGGGTRGVRRMHQLANSVLIFDEIQAIPVNCMHLFCNALNFLTQHGGTTAVLCTATQPLLNKLYAEADVDVCRANGQLTLSDSAEIIQNPPELFHKLKRVDILDCTVPGGKSMADIAKHVLSRYNKTGSCLVVVNTKRCARTLYELCSNAIGDDDAIFHLSTGQYPAHRRAIISSIKERLGAKPKKPVLCISTQLIEAGVDISFASVVRFLAGLDSVAQAAGRCNRSGELVDALGRPIKGQVDIVNSDSEKIDLLVDIKEAQRCTMRILDEFEESELLTAEAMEQYFKYYLEKRRNDMTYPLNGVDNVAGDNLLSLLSTNESNVGSVGSTSADVPKLPLLRQSFAEAANAFKAIDAPLNSVIVRHGLGVSIVDALCSEQIRFSSAEFYKNLKRAQQYSVNVFPNVWQELLAAGAVFEIECGEKSGIYYLDSQYYSEEFGLSTEVVSVSEILIN